MKYIDQEGYEVGGDSIEIALIDWSVTENPEEQVTEIQIPIMKKQSSRTRIVTNGHQTQYYLFLILY